MGRPGPWPITAHAACDTRHAGQRGDRDHSCHSGVAALAGGRRRGGERKMVGGGGLTKHGVRERSGGRPGLSAGEKL
jgi:hypothetical protein